MARKLKSASVPCTEQPAQPWDVAPEFQQGLLWLSFGAQLEKKTTNRIPKNFAPGGGAYVQDFMDATPEVLTGTGVGIGPLVGMGLSTTSALGSLYYLAPTPLNSALSSTGEVTLLAVHRSRAQDASGDKGVLVIRNGSANKEHYPYTDGLIYMGPFSSTRWVSGATPPTDIHRPHAIAISHKSGSQEFWYSGKRIATGSVVETPAISAADAKGFGANGANFFFALYNRNLPEALKREFSRNPNVFWAARRVLVPVSVAGGAITIDGNAGNATAAGTAGQVGVAITVDATTGNATAAGTTAQVGVAIDIAGNVGAATAAGTTAGVAVDVTVSGGVGNAVAAGITGGVDLGGNISIDGNVGAAVAAGVQGLPGVGITVNGSVGAASAAGISGTVSFSNDITINGSVGSAAAAGILATLTLEINLTGAVGNATAAGVTASLSMSGAEVFSAPPLVQRLESSTRLARTSASRGARLQSRNR